MNKYEEYRERMVNASNENRLFNWVIHSIMEIVDEASCDQGFPQWEWGRLCADARTLCADVIKREDKWWLR